MKHSLIEQLFLLLLFIITTVNGDIWNRRDEQLRYGQKKLSTKSDDTKTIDGENIVDGEENSSNDDGKTLNYPIETSRSLIRQNMDNIVKDMRTKTLNKMFQGSDIQEMVDSNPVYNEAIGNGVSVVGGGSHNNEEGNIQIAVKSKRKYEFVPFHYDREEMKTPRMIEIVSDTMPLRLHFKSQSAAIVVTQSHMSPPMKPIEEKVTMDEPYRISHEVHKPIIQEVKEIIQPYRNIVQQLKPVIEDIRTIVPKDSDVGHNHMTGTASSKTNDWFPVSTSGIKRSAASLRSSPSALSSSSSLASASSRLSPAQQLQSRYNRQATQVLEGVKASESRSRIQRRAHSYYDESRLNSQTVPPNQFYHNKHHQQNRPMDYDSSEQEIIYEPMYSKNNNNISPPPSSPSSSSSPYTQDEDYYHLSRNDNNNNHRPSYYSMDNDNGGGSLYSESVNNLSDYINRIKNEENDEAGLNDGTLPSGSIGETLVRAKRQNNIHSRLHCNEIGCEMDNGQHLPSWFETSTNDNDYNRHYF